MLRALRNTNLKHFAPTHPHPKICYNLSSTIPIPSVTILNASPLRSNKSNSSQAVGSSDVGRIGKIKAKNPSNHNTDLISNSLGTEILGTTWFTTMVNTLRTGSTKYILELGFISPSYSILIPGPLDRPDCPKDDFHTFFRTNSVVVISSLSTHYM